MLYFPYNSEVARVVAARFIINEGGRMNYTKLMKLMYLLERRSLMENCAPVVGGRYVAMNHGPLISQVYDDVKANAWDGIELCGYNMVWQGDAADVEDYLSDWEEENIDALSEQFKGQNYSALIDYTHRVDVCPEWGNVARANTSTDIKLRDIPGCNVEELESYAREMTMFNDR